ncbi:beta-lactamase family protein [Ruficoccus amylovorans]|uniref:Beta-lactamase family protein n=1 Tax=Ruficoccus amylovorans TaxID=1804625 RepID=A0A842HDY6_9BACT|nr:serine hydrolase domain-containing protein [Ruficoccus amylovorans]MBC2593561.1 beta-lactamase family protein [Ruficoccus amylovorans]
MFFPAKECLRAPLALLVLTAFWGGSQAAASEQSDIEAIIDAHYDQPGRADIPGMVVGVWQGDTAVTVSARGYSDLDLDASGVPGSNPVAMQYSDQMRIASLTKTFTVTRILQLAAEGVIGLDDPISNYDGMGGISLAGLNTDPSFNASNPVTIRDLARMTSSLANYSASEGMMNGLINDISTSYTESQLIDFAKGMPATPATWTYSNTNTVLLGMIVEAVTGNSLGDELRTHVFDPVGLSADTYYPTDINFTGEHAHGYGPDGEGIYEDFTAANPTMAAGAGAMISTFDDLRQWIEAVATGILADGSSLYGDSPEAAAMQAERLLMVAADGAGPYYDEYGLGIGEIEEWLGHSGEFLGYQHIIMYDPETDRTVVIMINMAGFEDGEHVPTEMFIDIAKYYASVPEPSTIAFLALAGVGVLLLRRRLRA